MPKEKSPTPQQSARAARLRGIIEVASEGKKPPAPETPREITDEAARTKRERLRKQK